VHHDRTLARPSHPTGDLSAQVGDANREHRHRRCGYHSRPQSLYHFGFALTARAAWDADGVRDDLRGYVVEHLGDPDAVLVVDEAGSMERWGLPRSGYSGSTPAGDVAGRSG
jgi:hypothetical protein